MRIRARGVADYNDVQKGQQHFQSILVLAEQQHRVKTTSYLVTMLMLMLKALEMDFVILV